MSNLVPILGVNRHRLLIDGEGVTTLVAFHGCPLHCKYCLNPQSLSDDFDFPLYSCEQLYERVKVDELYFLATRLVVVSLVCEVNLSAVSGNFVERSGGLQ